MKYKTILLYGYYGHDNIGDDLMLEGLVNHLLEKYKVSVMVLTASNLEFLIKYNVKQILLSRNNIIEVLFGIYEADLVVWGGGTCFYDTAGLKGLREIKKIQILCKLLFTDFGFLNVGVGTISTEQGWKLIDRLVNNSVKVLLRDSNSLKLLLNRKRINKVLIHKGNDLIFLKNFTVNPVRRNKKRIMNLSFSGVYFLDENISFFYAKILNHLVQEIPGIRIHFLPAHTGVKNDNIFHEKIAKYLKKGNWEICRPGSHEGFIMLMQQMDFHIGMRLHSIIIADLLALPNIGLNYSNKVKYYLEYDCSSKRVFEIGEPFDKEDLNRVMLNYDPALIPKDSFRKEVEKSLELLVK
jgi:polysaccharide pyruvyl transferase WcaK-like protein